MDEKLIVVDASGEMRIPKEIKDDIKEIAVVTNNAIRDLSKTERTAFLFVISKYLQDCIVFASISDSNTVDKLNEYINNYKPGEKGVN